MTFERVQSSDGYQEQTEQPGAALWQFAEDVAGALVSPSETLRQVGQRQAILPAIILVLLIVGIHAAGQITVLLLTTFQVPGFESQATALQTGPVVGMQLAGILWNFVWGPVLWTIVALLLYGAAYLLGGRGRFPSLWAATGFALAPQLLVAPLSAANELLGALGAGLQLLGWIVLLPVSIGAFIWSLILLAISVRETMGVSTGRGFGAVGLLLGGAILLGILLVCLFFLLFAAIIGAFVAA